ncbi:Maf family protein [Aurantivibrio infirmus]
MSLYLASQSPRRREILDQIGVKYDLLSVSVDESLLSGENPVQTVTRLAELKAKAGLEQLKAESLPSILESSNPPNITVLGADTIVVISDEILGKPINQSHAAEMLNKLSGTTHQVMSAVSLQSQECVETAVSITEVSFKEIHEQEIADYWRSGEPLDKAGGYGIQGLGAIFVTKIHGSYSGVVGLPIETLVPLLNKFKIPTWQKAHQQNLSS